MEVVVAVGVGWGCLDCSTGLGAVKSEGPDPVPPTLGKVNVSFVVEGVALAAETGASRLVENENVCAGVAMGLEVVIAGGTGVTGLEKKSGTAVLLVVEGPGFVVEGGMVVVAGLAKKFGTADCAGAGTEFEDVGTGVGVANKFFAGSSVSHVSDHEASEWKQFSASCSSCACHQNHPPTNLRRRRTSMQRLHDLVSFRAGWYRVHLRRHRWHRHQPSDRLLEWEGALSKLS